MSSGVTLAILNLASILIVRMLGVTGRGEVAAAVLIPTIIAYGGWLGLPVATGYWVNTDPTARAKIIGTVRATSIIISVPLCVISILLSFVIPHSDSVRLTSIAFVAFIPLNLFVGIHQSILQADLRGRTFNLVRIAGAGLYLLILVALFIFSWGNTLTIVIAQLCGNIAWFFLGVCLVRSSPWLSFDRSIARTLLSYGARAHLGSMSPVDGLRIDQLILSLLLTTYDLGLYVVVMSFVTANRMIGQSLGIVAFPLASRSGEYDARRKKLLLGGLICAGFLLCAITVSVEIVLGEQLLSVLFNVSSPESYQLLVVLAIGSVFMCIRQISSDILRGLGKPGVPSWGESISLITLGVGITLLWDRGVVGVGWAVSIAYAASCTFVLAALIHFTLGGAAKTWISFIDFRPLLAERSSKSVQVVREGTEKP